ncbi:spatzle 5 Toll-1 receptor isoform X1 [Arctopsyche grandis]|uniref:spatzle 5 Toll-1 receptor isoform X1 n=1 Tax=Arctopsyche grandis TaxID=121162 RepID=UPI00406D9B22
MATISKKQITCITIVIFGQLLYPCNSVRRCGHGLDYGGDCSFVPAPPGRTPACAAPGYTYCEQLDYYPNDLIRHLVEKGEYDFSTLLSDETRDDFGATRPTQGPYGYGPHSLSGTQGISLITERPAFAAKQPSGQDLYRGGMPFSGNGQFPTQSSFQGPQYFGPNKGNTLSPPGGYVGYYTPSQQQRPQSQPYPPPRDSSYLPPKVSNTSTGTGIRLDQFGDFWRGNSYFEVPRANYQAGRYLDYDDNNGGSPYYSAAGEQTGARHQTIRPTSQADWSSAVQQSKNDHFLPPAVTNYNPNDWWQRFSTDPPRSPITQQQSSYKSVDSNDIKIRTISKRETTKGGTSPNNDKNPFTDIRSKRQAQAPSGEQLCPTRSQFIMPKAALNKQGNWMYVVNMGQIMDSQYSQLVKSEICVSQQCDGICSLPLGYVSRCEQKYVQKRLVALDQGGQRLYTDIFWFPSCCLCTINNNQT